MVSFHGGSLDELVLRGPRLVLRPWHHSDSARVHEVMQDPGMHEFLTVPRPYTRADADAFVLEFAPDARRDGSALECAVVERDGLRVVGSCRLRLEGEPDIGYWVAPDARGLGYAAEATRTIAEWAFTSGVQRIVLRCDTRNVASARAAMAAGFAYEGVARESAAHGPDKIWPDGTRHRGDLARFARLAGDSGDPVPPRLRPFPLDGVSDGVLALRTTVAGDADGMRETDDDETLRWNFDGLPTPPERLYAACANAGLSWLVDRVAMMTMIDVATGSFAGGITLRTGGPPGLGSIGYVVHPRFRGRGFTTRALRLLAGWAFGEAGFARLELGAKTGNIASQRAALNAGFEPDGVRIARLGAADGSFHDEAQFALINTRITRSR